MICLIKKNKNRASLKSRTLRLHLYSCLQLKHKNSSGFKLKSKDIGQKIKLNEWGRQLKVKMFCRFSFYKLKKEKVLEMLLKNRFFFLQDSVTIQNQHQKTSKHKTLWCQSKKTSVPWSWDWVRRELLCRGKIPKALSGLIFASTLSSDPLFLSSVAFPGHL